jgi:hypothetical protein
MTNPTEFTWTDPTTNVDGSPLDPSEITSYNIGIRLASGTPGVYTTIVNVAGPTAHTELLSAISPPLAPGSYAAAVQAVGPVDSAFSTEATFTIVPPTPSAPTGFTVG